MKILSFCLVLMLPLASAFAQPTGGNGASDNDLQLNTITTALPFMAITPDSRAGGMGDAGTALSPSSTSVYWNTARLIVLKHKRCRRCKRIWVIKYMTKHRFFFIFNHKSQCCGC